MSPEAAWHLVDELLEEIFLRLPTPAALAGSSTASPRFRRIITDRSFLRRYRKLHPPPLLGFADDNGFHPVQAPHPSAPLARALADAADFNYSFVPKPREGRWSPCDARDGRVLLESTPPGQVVSFLSVCDPLSRRYVLIPPIPENLAVQREEFVEIQSLLAPIGDDEDEETSFRVICVAHYDTKLVAFVFSSVTGNWCVAASISWTSLGTDEPKHALADRSHLHGCFYWTELWVDKLLVLDTRSMEFSTIDFLTGYHKQIVDQPGQSRQGSYVVAGRGGDEALEVFSLIDDQSTECSFAVHHTIQQMNDQSSMEWRLEKIIPLPGHCYCCASGAAEEFLFIGATKYTEIEPSIDNAWLMADLEDYYLSLEVQTSEMTEVYRKKETLLDCENVYWYFGFPPSLSKPSI